MFLTELAFELAKAIEKGEVKTGEDIHDWIMDFLATREAGGSECSYPIPLPPNKPDAPDIFEEHGKQMMEWAKHFYP